MIMSNLTGYPSIDKPWLKYYSQEAISAALPECTIYDYLYESNKDYRGRTALNYFGRKISYGELLENIEKTARALRQNGIGNGKRDLRFISRRKHNIRRKDNPLWSDRYIKCWEAARV